MSVSKGKQLDGLQSGSALISECGTYRYLLQRRWDEARPAMLWVMLNPSTADADEDDATIRRCIGFSRDWGYGSLSVVNLYGLRSTDSRKLLRHPDPIGPDNDLTIALQAKEASDVVVAWGNDARNPARIETVVAILRANLPKGITIHCLGKTNAGKPRHPVRLGADTPLEPFYG